MRLSPASRLEAIAPRLFAALLVGSAVATAIACSDDGARACRVGADCASGMCGPDGSCVAGGATSSSGGGGAPADDGGTTTDSSPPPDDGGGQVLPGCVPNQDGTITRDEVPIQAGLHATFRIAANVATSTAGTPTTNGRRKWDLSGALANDANVLVETLPLTGTWYGDKFKGGTYATRLSQAYDLLGVFETAPGSLALRGVASPSDGAARTELTYDPPADFLQFPLTLGKTWSTSSKVTGTAQGVIFAGLTEYTEKYDAKVDAAGELVTPLGTFEVLRVRLDLTQTNYYGVVLKTSRSYAFVTECFGNVASIASNDNEPNEEFTQAAEVRRIAP